MPITVDGTKITKVKFNGIDLSKVYYNAVLVFSKGGQIIFMKYFFGNHKMNDTKASIDEWCSVVNDGMAKSGNAKMVVFPPACYLTYMRDRLDAAFAIGIQDVATENKGAYTGQISAAMAKDCGCKFALVGNSETRQFLGVTDKECNLKIQRCIENGLIPVLCVGENLEQHDAGETQRVLRTQINTAFEGISPDNVGNSVIVYEPIWAIGTGKTITPDEAQATCLYIKDLLYAEYSDEVSERCIVLFGGPATMGNINELMAKPDIRGVLTGGVSLRAAEWTDMVNRFI